MPQRRKTNQHHVAAGTFRSDRHGSPVTESPAEKLTELPEPPDDALLNDVGVERWYHVGEVLVEAGRLARQDLYYLQHHCLLWQDIRAHREFLDEKRTSFYGGAMQLDDDEIKQAHSHLLRLQPQYEKTMDNLGMHAVSRSRSSVATPTKLTTGVPTRRRT